MPTVYRVRVESEKVGSLVGLNDAPVIADPIGLGVKVALPVNEWIIPDFDNKFTALLTAPETGEPFERGTASVDASCFRVDPASQTGEAAATLAQFRWPLPTPEVYPFPFSAPVEFDRPVPAVRLWEEAERFESLSAEDTSLVRAMADHLVTAFKSGDPDRIYELLRYKLEDYCLAYEIEQEAIRASAVDQFRMITSQDNASVNNLESAKLNLRLICDNRVVQLIYGADMRLIKVSGDRYTYTQMVYAAKVGGEWKVVR